MVVFDRRAVCLLLAVTAALIPATTSAHPNHGPSWGERYLKLDVTPDGLRVVYGVTFISRFGRKVRMLADANDNVRVDADETAGYGRSITGHLRADVELTIDDEAAELQWARPFFAGLEGPVRGGAVTFETSARVALAPGRRRLRLADSAEFDGIYRTTGNIAVAPELTVLRAGRGPTPRGKRLRHVFLDLPSEGAPPPRVLTAEVELPGAPPLGGTSVLVTVAVGVGILLMVGLGMLVGVRARRYRRKG